MPNLRCSKIYVHCRANVLWNFDEIFGGQLKTSESNTGEDGQGFESIHPVTLNQLFNLSEEILTIYSNCLK